VVWADCHKKPFEVVHRRPRLTLVIACGSRGAPHAGAAHLAIVVIGRGHGPLKALLAPLFATFAALLGAMGGDVGRRLPVATRGHLPASLGRAEHDHLIAGGVLGGDATWLLERVPKEVATSVLPRALRTALGPALTWMMVPTLSWIASQRASSSQIWPEPS
jgi:hypothetical protein